MACIDNYTKVLLHFNDSINAGICPGYAITGNVSIDKNIYKFNNGSCKFDGKSILTISNLDFSGSYTIDFWVYINSLYNTDNHILQIRNASKGWLIGVSRDGYVMYWNSDSGSTYTSSKLTLNTWYHIELVKTSNNFYVFVNGTKHDLSSLYMDVSDINNLIIGGRYDNLYNTNCNIDELRVSIGVARHTSDFNPETREYGYGYLITDSNNNFYNLDSANYDYQNNKYNAISNFNMNNFDQYAFTLNDLYSNSPNGIQNYKLFNHDYKLVLLYQPKIPLIVEGLKNIQEMVATLEPLNMKKYVTIKKITPNFDIGRNANVKIAFSFDEGTSWETWDYTNGWVVLNNTSIPLKLYENFTDSDKIAWSNAQADIYANGIDIRKLSSVIFPTDVTKMLFAIVFNKPSYSDTATLSSFDILYDGLKEFIGLDRSECKIKFSGDTITATPTSSADQLLITMITGTP